MFSVNNGNTRRCSGVFLAHFEYIWRIAIAFFADFEQEDGRWHTLLLLPKFTDAF